MNDVITGKIPLHCPHLVSKHLRPRTLADCPPGPGTVLHPQAHAGPSQGATPAGRLSQGKAAPAAMRSLQEPLTGGGGGVGGWEGVFRVSGKRVVSKFTQFQGGNQVPAAWPPGLGRPGPRELPGIYRGSNQQPRVSVVPESKVQARVRATHTLHQRNKVSRRMAPRPQPALPGDADCFS